MVLTNTIYGRWTSENGSIQRSNIKTYGLVLKSAKKTHLWSSCTISPTNNTVGRWMYENGSIQRSNIRTYGFVLKSAKRTHLWSSCIISLTNAIVGRWTYKSGSSQRSNIRTHELVLKSAKKLIFQLHAQGLLPIILLGVECTRMVAFNALTSGPMNSCLNQINNSFAIFTYIGPYQ